MIQRPLSFDAINKRLAEILDGGLSGRVISGYAGRNAIINGDFRFWQRGLTFTSVGYTADRWRFNFGGVTNPRVVRTHLNPPDLDLLTSPSRTLCKVAHDSTTDMVNSYVVLEQRIENVETLAGRTVTISLPVYCEPAHAAAGRYMALECQQFFGVGAGSSATIEGIGAKKFKLEAGINFVQSTFTLPSVQGKTINPGSFLCVTLWSSAGSSFGVRTAGLGVQNGNVYFGEVQVELGEVATPFEYRPDTLEFALCQRYYEKLEPLEISGGAFNTSDVMFGCDFATQKRTPPALSVATYPLWVGNGSTGTTNTITFGAVNTSGFRGDVTGFSGTITRGFAYNLRGGVFLADAEI